MSTHRYIDRICCIALAFTLSLTVLFISASGLDPEVVPQEMGYEGRLFDDSYVHTLDIVMDDWEDFISTCTNEEYSPCSVVIDGESFRNVGVRGKGNTSLSQVESYGSDRYSFKIEFDHYEAGNSYYGLDKLSLNNIIQDNTYMKDYLSYKLMEAAGAVSPLCSYVYIRVNGEDWGLYLAVEGVEESFLQRNYGAGQGKLYKPDSMNIGGGTGGKGDFDKLKIPEMPDMGNMPEMPEGGAGFGQMPGGDGLDMPDMSDIPDMDSMPDMPEGGGAPGGFQGFGGGSGSSDVSLVYSDDQYSSYSNIFDNAKTDITDADRDRLIAALKRLNSQEALDSTVDVESVIRYFVAHNFVCNFDSYTGSMIHNYYLYEDGGQLSMIPWDYNLAFGGFMGSQNADSMINYPIDTPVSGGSVDSRPMLAWIFSSEEYTGMYHQYFAELISGFFDSGSFAQEFDRAAALIAPYVEKDPTAFCSYEEFKSGAAALKEFCLLRAKSISGQLDGSIPSTSEGQAEDSSALIDGSAVNMSDMGSMGGGFGGMGRGEFQDRRQASDNGESGGETNSPVSPGQPRDGDTQANARTEGRPPQNSEGSGPMDFSGLLTTGICILVLAAAITAMALYRKKA